MRGLLIVLMSFTLAATGLAQSRRGGGGGGGSRVGARSFAGGGAVRGGFAGGGVSRGFAPSSRGYVGGGYYGGYGYPGYGYPGYGYGVGLGYAAPYAPYCYGPGYYEAYGCGYPAYGYYAAPRVVVPRVMIGRRPGVIVGGGWQRFGRR